MNDVLSVIMCMKAYKITVKPQYFYLILHLYFTSIAHISCGGCLNSGIILFIFTMIVFLHYHLAPTQHFPSLSLLEVRCQAEMKT